MKTLNNLKDASTIFALCAAFVLFLTSCEKEDLGNMNGLPQSDQALQCQNCNDATQNIDFATGQIRFEKAGNNDLGISRNNVDNAHNGQIPNRTANNNTTNETNSQYEKNKLVQYPVDVNIIKDRLEPIHHPGHK